MTEKRKGEWRASDQANQQFQKPSKADSTNVNCCTNTYTIMQTRIYMSKNAFRKSSTLIFSHC